MAAATEKTTFSAEEVRALITETTKSIFEQFGPVLQSIALTPEKLREAQKPYVDPMELARRLHEREEFQESEREQAELTRQRQANCSHKDENGDWSINLQHNFHDNMPRGLCPLCGLLIAPLHWDYRPHMLPDGKIKSEAFVVPAHPLYYLVQQLEVAS